MAGEAEGDARRVRDLVCMCCFQGVRRPMGYGLAFANHDHALSLVRKSCCFVVVLLPKRWQSLDTKQINKQDAIKNSSEIPKTYTDTQRC